MKFKLTMVLALLCAGPVMADNGWSGGPGGMGDDHPHLEHGPDGPGGPNGRADFEACAAELGITLPEPGSGTKPSSSDMQKMKSCLDARHAAEKAAMDACLAGAGVTFGSDGRPTTRPSKDVMDSCRAQVSTATATATDTSTAVSSSAI